MEDSARKTFYRKDSGGDEQNRVRPRAYSFEDIIEEEEVRTKVARTKSLVDFRHKAFAQSATFVKDIKSEESAALEQFFFKSVEPETSTSETRVGDDYDRNDSIETQPSLGTSFGLVQPGGIISDATDAVESSFGRVGEEELLDDNQQENKVIKLEERAPPAEEDSDVKRVDVVLVVNAESVTVHFDVCLDSPAQKTAESLAARTGGDKPSTNPTSPKPSRKKKKKQKKAEDLTKRLPWTVGARDPPKISSPPPKAHKVFNSEKKLSYSNKRDLLISHLRSVASKQEEKLSKSPEPAQGNRWKRSIRKVSNVVAFANDSYLAALDSAKRAKQLNADRLTPPKSKKILRKIMDPNSDYKKRYGRLSPRNAAKRSPASASKSEEPTAKVSLKLAELFNGSGLKENTVDSPAVSSPVSPPSAESTPSAESPPVGSPPPVQMSLKLSDIGVPLVHTFHAVNKFKSFKLKRSAEASPDPASEPEQQQGKESDVEEEEVESIPAENDNLEQDGEAAVYDKHKIEEEIKDFLANSPAGDDSENEAAPAKASHAPVEEIEEIEVGIEENKGPSSSPNADAIDPKIVEYFRQNDDKKTGKSKSKSKEGKDKTKKPSKLKKLLNNMLCRKV